MADSNKTGLRYFVESSWGSATINTTSELRYTSESLAYNIGYTQSQEIVDSREVTDIVQTDKNTGGGFNFELSYATFDDFIAGALMSTWSTPGKFVGVAATVTAAVTINGINGRSISFPLGATTYGYAVVGQFVRITSPSALIEDKCDKYRQIRALERTAGGTCNLILAPALLAAPGISAVTLEIAFSSKLRNASTEKSFTLERKHTDIGLYFQFSGMVPSGMNLNVSADSFLQGNFDFIGKTAVATTTPVTGTITAANTNSVMNAMSNVGNVLEGSTLTALSSTVLIQSLDLTINNNVREIKALGHTGAADLGYGKFDCSGNMSIYLHDKTFFDKYTNQTESGFSFTAEDQDDQAYVFTMPRIQFESDSINVGGQDQDVSEQMGFRALRHPTLSCTLQIDKFAAPTYPV